MDDGFDPSAPRQDRLSADFQAVFRNAPSPLLLIANDPPRFTMVAVNEAHAYAFGARVHDLEGRGVFEVLPDPPTEVSLSFGDAVRSSFERVLATRAADEMAPRPYAIMVDGRPEPRYWGAINRPLMNEAGAITHIISTVRDITSEVNERKASEARDLLMREVDHRARNALTVVQSVVRLTRAPSLEAFKAIVLGRVESLARAQTSLAQRKWEGADLRNVITAELDAIAPDGGYSVQGPSVLLKPEHVQALSMAIHELATNARKYGGMSVPQGRVAVEWELRDDNDLRLVWRESGGPAVNRPHRRGFGSQMIEQLAKQLDGRVDTHWRAEGLEVELHAVLN